MFDIDLPEDDAPAPAAPVAPEAAPRRGPMASAVRENAESLRERRDLEARIRAENDALAHEHARLKREGLIVDRISVYMIDAGKMTRDRSAGPDPELAELKASILEIGLSNPIRVESKKDGRYELIQGWRRLQAFKELESEYRDGRFLQIPAGLVAPGDALPVSYRRMVDENLVRKDISFAEMAKLAQAYAADPETKCDDVDKAVATLFKSAGYQKRSYIRAFAALLDALGDALKHPEALGRNQGLALRKALDGDPGLVERARRVLAAKPQRDAETELAILRDVMTAEPPMRKAAAAKPQGGGRAKTNLRVDTALGEVRCTAANGRLEIRGATDFSSVEARRLEAALSAFMAALARDGQAG